MMVPPHLYGQLSLTNPGLKQLLGEPRHWEMVKIVQEVGAGHYTRYMEQRAIISCLVNTAESCPYLSVSSTAYYALATNTQGSEALGYRGWGTIRHCRGDQWPIATDWLQQTDIIRDLAVNRYIHTTYICIVPSVHHLI